MSLTEVLPAIDRWREAGEAVVLATVVATWGSAPLRAGAAMAIAGRGGPDALPRFAGSVSGGCVEAAVIDAAMEILSGGPPRLLRFGVTDDEALAVGLSCGGTIEVFVEALPERADPSMTARPLQRWLWAAREGRAAVRVVCIGTTDEGPRHEIGFSRTHWVDELSNEVDPAIQPASSWMAMMAVRAVEAGETIIATHAGTRYAAILEEPAPLLFIVGAGDVAQQLAPLASAVGFRVLVVDPRAAFASAERFPAVERRLSWPELDALRELGLDQRAYLVALAHDQKIDDPAIMAALHAEARYIGALGGNVSHQSRVERLALAGATMDQLQRINAPVGLPIGAQTPAEIAMAITAQLVAVRRGVS